MLKKKQWNRLLGGPLPGEQAHKLMAPEFRGTYSHAASPLPAAVMVLIYPAAGQTNLVFIKRNAYDGHHSAQVSFPGGAWESEDVSLEFTALRETREELGISQQIEVLGALTELYIPVSNFLVTPFVGWMDQRPLFRPDPSEVQYVIECSVKALLDPGNRHSEKVYRHGQTIMAPYFSIGEEKIWGATAMMLSEFLQLAATQL